MAPPWEENKVYCVTMDDALTDVPSLAGDKTLAVFLRAGFTKIGHLYTPADQASRITQAINDMKAEARTPINDSACNGLKTRCFTIIARIRCAEAQPVPPRPFCCHITYEVMTKYGYTYERNNIVT
eukprot:gene1188-32527_t